MPNLNWDLHYQSDFAPWETGYPSTELRRVVTENGIQPGQAIELGCGTGINAIWLAQQGFEVTAVDISSLAIEKARRRTAAVGVAVRFVQADVLNLPDDYGLFHFFFDRGCYHAVRNLDVQAYLRTLQRVMTPGSLGLVLTGNARDSHEKGRGPPLVSAEELRAELEPTFEIVRLREFHFDTREDGQVGPLGWSCLVQRQAL